jgi:hypothetical protein
MANKSYSQETVLRAFVMYLEYMSYAEIAGYDGMPTEDTISRWAKTGEATEEYPWPKIREMTATRRAMVSYDREIGERAQKPWAEKVDEMTQDLLDARDTVMQAIEDGTHKEVKIKDLIDIIKAEALVHGEATQRTEKVANLTQVLGSIVANRIRQNLQDQNLADRILDLIAQDFEAAMASGGDVSNLKKIAPD